MSQQWDYERYWTIVFGAKRWPDEVVSEFGLRGRDETGLSEWIGHAEYAAWAWSTEGLEGQPMPDEWKEFHRKALEELRSWAVLA